VSTTIRVELPTNLCILAGAPHQVTLTLDGSITQRTILDALEASYPMLEGTIRDHTTQIRRPFIRFFACEQDLSHTSPDEPLPEPIAQGTEPFLIIGAIAGG
jgi:sulfur-carrier protein